MTQNNTIFNSVAPLGNVRALIELIIRVQNRAFGLPGLACFYGPSGFGKSTAAIFATNKFDAHSIQVKECWNLKHFLQKLAIEIGLDDKGTIPQLAEKISDKLAIQNVPLIVDDCQYLITRKSLGVLRDIYESSFVPVIVIGEEKLPAQIAKFENINGRIFDWTPAEAATIDDFWALAPIYAPDIEISDDLARLALEQSRHSIRRICVNLAKIKETANLLGQTSMSQNDWGGRKFCQTSAPAPRRELG